MAATIAVAGCPTSASAQPRIRRCFVDATQISSFDGLVPAKVAVGENYETVGISGSSVTSGFGGAFPAGGAVFPGGFFAQATNIGQQSRNQFALVPEVQAQLGYRLARLRRS